MSELTRRTVLGGLAATAATGCITGEGEAAPPPGEPTVLDVGPLGFLWETRDPFLFCAHHDDRYPKGNEALGPVASLAGRDLGRDFELRDGFRMYHGRVVPGFPRHPHRGFETVTVVRTGLLDHADSLGAGARYGGGDVQWLTAGKGIQHAEMFPLLRRDDDNPLELFQVWLNLPARSKMVDPRFQMLWRETIPTRRTVDMAGRASSVTVIAGRLGDVVPPAPPPDSWASHDEADVAIWTLKLDPEATLALPAARPGTVRTLYVFLGQGLTLNGEAVLGDQRVDVRAEHPLKLQNGSAPTEILMLQGRPIGEPVAHRGPFVMNTETELAQAFADYRRTGFGGWPWERDDPVHGAEPERFARHVDGRIDRPT